MEAQRTEILSPGQPVYNLQTMLRTISFQHKAIPQLIPTGLFDEPTLEAVMIFQRDFHPPVTGVVNADTWNAIANQYRAVIAEMSIPYPCVGFPFGSLTIQPGDASVHLPVIQAMFQALSTVLEGIESGSVTGIHDDATVHNTLWLGECDGCTSDGAISRHTWNNLARLYRVFIGYRHSPQLSRQELLNPS